VKFRLTVALVAAFMISAVPASAETPAACLGDDEAAAVCLVNQARASQGLRELVTHPLLTQAAEGYARRMSTEGFFSHEDPRGDGPAERMLASRYGTRRADRPWSAGEALGQGTGAYNTPSAIVLGWLTSPSHRAIVLGKSWRHIGIGIVDRPGELGELPERTYVLYAGYKYLSPKAMRLARASGR
jgi:uncharacterized protein YkwD